MKLKKKEGQKVDALIRFRRENKTLMGGNNGTNRGAGMGEKNHPKTVSLGDPSHMQPLNPSTIADVK